jgi:heat shock protein HtpX
LVITALCGLVFGIGMLVLLKLQVPREFLVPAAGGFAILMVLLQYGLGPVLIDAVVKIRWTNSMELGPDFDLWLRKTCSTFKIPSPKFGIIEEGSPNAFTYGNGPWNARVVVTRGVIDALEPEELKAVVAHELGHIRNRDFIVMTIVQALVLALYSLYIASRYAGRRNGWYVAIMSFIAYQLSYYISLLLSRIREYMADFASGQIMSNGNDLSSALVKIAYGMGRFQATPTVQSPVPYPRSP